jgi:SAM-dependent methyltransferase
MGRVTRALASRVARVIALDVSGEMLGRARAQNPGLANVSWTLGDGRSLASIEDGEASVCFSHVVFQHIPDPSVTLGYVREMGRVLQPGGWAAFVVSTDPAVHRPRRRARLRRMLRPPGPEEQDDLAWMGAAVDLHSLRAAAEAGGMQIERIVNEGEQFCLVIARRGP